MLKYEELPDLTPTDMQRIAELIYFLSERGNKWTSMEQTTDSIPLYPTLTTDVYHNSAARRLLTRDIEYINTNDVIDKIIISGSRGIKIANEDDLDEFLKAEFTEVFKKLKRLRKIAKKATHDQQISLEGKIREIFLKEG